MHIRIKVSYKTSWIKQICCLFLLCCFVPFLFPNPIVKTNIQPYAAVLGAMLLLLRWNKMKEITAANIWLIIGGMTFLASVMLIFVNGVTMNAFRAVYNYFALFVIPCATVISLVILDGIPERLFKAMILFWFAVSTIQFFIYRGFATNLISGVRWSYEYRGVVGLASEPSFLGIACFYFLHIVQKFEEKRFFYTVLILIMGTLYAQSAMGVLFIAGYYVVYLVDVINSKKGIIIWIVSIIAAVSFFVLLNTRLSNSRLSQMVGALFSDGISGVLSDASAGVRWNAIKGALDRAWKNGLLPNGFNSRIGSGYGGLLVELGVLAIPIMTMISFRMSKTFKKLSSQMVYFVVVTILLFNNTQMGNPLLLLVVGINSFYNESPGRSEQCSCLDGALHQQCVSCVRTAEQNGAGI